MSEILDALQRHNHTSDHVGNTGSRNGVGEFDDRTASTIWKWLTSRRDISVGPNRSHNHLSLHEVLSLPPPDLDDKKSNHVSGEAPVNTATSTSLNLKALSAKHVRVFASEETMWESLTGHAVDYKRVPRSEWLLLMGIASTKSEGILQGDLGRLVDQDKRSVPKRTDSLVRKGYITKRTTLVRGTKTSKMWLKQYAPPLPKDLDDSTEVGADMNLSHEVLAANLDPVPWHTRWTADSIDYTALATTIIAVSREWGVMRMSDLKAKLGVLRLRWQMKVLSKVCRFLNARGVIQYVAAKLGDKVFKDCIKYGREMSPDDWSAYLATGKRTSKIPKPIDTGAEGVEGGDQLYGQNTNTLEVSLSPPWTVDKPLPITIAERAWRFGDGGLTNPDVYGLTLGPSFSRYLSSMTTALSVPGLQPIRLRYLQLRSEHTRVGKIASYRYYAQQLGAPPPDSLDASTSTSDAPDDTGTTRREGYGFASLPTSSLADSASFSLSSLCNLGIATSKIGARGKKKAKPPGRPKRAPIMTETAIQNSQEEVEGVEMVDDPAVPEDKGEAQDLVDHSPSTPETRQETQILRQTGSPEPAGSSTVSLIIVLKVSAESLQKILEQEFAQDTTISGSHLRRSGEKQQTAGTELVETALELEDNIEISEKTPTIAKRRGRGKGKGRKSNKSGGTDTPSRPWKCENCGKTWKNDIGLKYHVEKSRSSCNPSYDETAEQTPRRVRRSLLSAIQRTPSPEPAMAQTTPQQQEGDSSVVEQHEERLLSIETRERRTRPATRSKPSSERKPPSARLSHGLIGGPSQTTPDWKRATVMSFNRSNISPFLVNGGSALLLDEDSHPRQILNSSRVQNEEHISNVPVWKNSPIKETPLQSENDHVEPHNYPLQSPHAVEEPCDTQAPPSLYPQPDLLYPTVEHADQLAGLQQNTQYPQNGSGRDLDLPVAKRTEQLVVPSSTTSKQGPRASLNAQIRGLIEGLLSEQDGVFPGGNVLRQAFSLRWGDRFPSQTAPTPKQFNIAFNEMVRNKLIADHWHSFRDKKGMFSRCQIIVLRKLDPFSTVVMEVLERIKAAFPQPYFPPPFTELGDVVPKDTRRGRRLLPMEVETLDAPVYAAQVAAKRSLDEYDNDDDDEDDEEEDYTPASKRSRRSYITRSRTKIEFASSVDERRAQVKWIRRDGRRCEGHRDSLPVNGPPAELQFLAPNTFLDEDPPEFIQKHISPFEKELSGKARKRYLSLPHQLPNGIVFDATIQISGINGSWPYLRVQDFEDEDASYTLSGWMPDSQWFSWSSLIEEIEKRQMAPGSIARTRNKTEDGQYLRFIDRLVACVETELAWTKTFVNASLMEAGPHNLFINFSNGPIVEDIQMPSLSWPLVGQLTLDSDLTAYSSTSDTDDFEDMSLYSRSPRKRSKLHQKRKETHDGSTLHAMQSRITQTVRAKRVPLVTRTLTAVRSSQPGSKDSAGIADDGHVIREPEKVLAAFIAVRVLLGGSDKAVDWGLLNRIFPDVGITQLRRFWIAQNKEQGPYIAKLTKDFQERFITAYEKNEVPELDFDNPLDYDWPGLIEWMTQLPRQDGIDIPSSRTRLHKNFDFHDVPKKEDDTQEKFFHVQSSVFARFEAVTCTAAAISIDEISRNGDNERPAISDLEVAKSWVKSLCCTTETKYSVQQIKDKFQTLVNEHGQQNENLLREALADLTQKRVICRSKRPPLGGRPYRLNEWYTYMTGKLSQRAKYRQAALFKAKLDADFRNKERVRVPFTLDDGSVMALTNLNAMGRIRIVPVDVPHIPYGFEPGNYESRKYPKSYYHFEMDVVPTETYLYDEGIDVLQAAVKEGPPLEGSRGELPQWIDFFGTRSPRRWSDILGAFCFNIATRGPMSIEGICSALKPLVEEYEAWMIIEWGKKTGVLKDMDGMGTTVGEWWWLAVPWQMK